MADDITWPNYSNGILGIPNSLLAHFGASPHHTTLPVLDKHLGKSFKNIVLLVFDGMGSDLLQSVSPGSFLLRNRVTDLSSVYPCTTTAALTTYLTGLAPIEHGWLGWSCYFKDIDKCVDLYSGNQSGTDRPATDHNIVWDSIGFKNLLEQISHANRDVECCGVSPFMDYKATTCEEVCSHILTLCNKEGRRYIYAYHCQPDHDMHEYGCYDDGIQAMMKDYDRQVEQLCENLTDTLLIVTADHGLTNIKMLLVENYPEIQECLSVLPSQEPRCVSLFVKPEYMNSFPERWKRRFGENFMLMTRQEALEKQIFGEGIPHRYAQDFIGDYVALAAGNLALWHRNEKNPFDDFKAAHAGLRREEMTVPLIIFER